MFIDGFESREDILSQFAAPKNALDDAWVYYAKYSSGGYDGSAFILFEKNGILYEVNGSHCSCHGLEGQWDPEETSMKALEHRWFQNNNMPYICESEQDVMELKRIILGEMFEQNVLSN